MGQQEFVFRVKEDMPSEPTDVDCINSLLEDYKSLLVEKRALEEVLLQLDIPDQLERSNRDHAENWRKMTPAFQVLHQCALTGNWPEFYKALRPDPEAASK